MKGGCASEVSGAVWFVLDIFLNDKVFRECLVDCFKKSVD